jgi:hypothetical protein
VRARGVGDPDGGISDGVGQFADHAAVADGGCAPFLEVEHDEVRLIGEQVRQLKRHVEERGEESVAVPRVLQRIGAGVHDLQRVLTERADEAADEGFLGFKVAVEATLGDAGVAGDVVDGDAVDAAFEEGAQGGAGDLLSARDTVGGAGSALLTGPFCGNA